MRPTGLVAYIAGAAATVGAGVVVGLAVAAPAAADASGQDSGHRGAAEHTSPARQGASRNGHSSTPRAAAAESAPSNRKGSGVATRVVRSVPEVSAPISITAGPQHHSIQMAQTAPAGLPAAATAAVTIAPPAPAATTPVPAATTPVPAARATAAAPTPVASTENPHNFYLDPRGQRVTFLKGTHFAIPGSFGLFVKKVYGTGTFTADSAYDLKDVDQYDWNKFSGIAFTPLQPDKNSAMVGWRYNIDTREYEIAPYYNVNTERILPNEQTEVISVPADATFHYNVDYSGVTLSYADKTVFKPYPSGLTSNVWTAARVSGWFGGNEAAPRRLSYYLSFNWW